MANSTRNDQTFPGDVKEKVFDCTKIYEFENPTPGKNTHVCEFFRSTPTVAERNPDNSVKTWGPAQIQTRKMYCTLPKGTKPSQVKYVEASYIAVEDEQKK